mgnify:CR=1 FL=1
MWLRKSVKEYLLFVGIVFILFSMFAVGLHCDACVTFCINNYCGIPSVSQRMACAEQCGCLHIFAYSPGISVIAIFAIVLSIITIVINVFIKSTSYPRHDLFDEKSDYWGE